ncbi:unnamed protein product [Amoebophrya sp. A25]|nr:unnamed protein product [Amoebophrya sp. A25]|eukprot:GSA25T00001836001.1
MARSSRGSGSSNYSRQFPTDGKSGLFFLDTTTAFAFLRYTPPKAYSCKTIKKSIMSAGTLDLRCQTRRNPQLASPASAEEQEKAILARLAQRLAICEQAIGGEDDSSNVYERVRALETKVDAIRHRTPGMQALEEQWRAIEPLAHEEDRHISNIILHRADKREYVLQHASELRKYAAVLRAIHDGSKFEHSWQDLGGRVLALCAETDRLAEQVSAMGQVVETLVQKYATVVNSISRRLLLVSTTGDGKS